MSPLDSSSIAVSTSVDFNFFLQCSGKASTVNPDEPTSTITFALRAYQNAALLQNEELQHAKLVSFPVEFTALKIAFPGGGRTTQSTDGTTVYFLYTRDAGFN